MSLAIAVTAHELSIERVFDAPQDLVFEVWSHPKHLVNWWGPNDFTLPHCVTDFRVGGAYRFCMRSPEGEDHWVSGVYREIEEPERIVKTWLREYTDGTVWCDTLLTLLFKGVGEKTIFRLHQTGFDSAEHRDQHHGGWSQCLDRLEKYVTV